MAITKATDGREAGLIALQGIQFNEAPRCGILGDSGCGKTNAIAWLIKMYREMERKGIVLIVDDKEAEAQFDGQERTDVNDLKTNPLDKDGPPVVVFRGDRFDREKEVDPETIAALQWSMAQQEQPSLGVYDELDKACNYGQWKAGDRSFIKWCFKKGRNVRAASLWGTQETQEVPAEAFNQSSSLIVFRMTGNPVRLLKQRGYLEGGVEKIIPQLPGDELPREQRGYFVLLQRGRPWNGKVYRFSGRP